MKWFGESWGAPINETCDQVPTPIKEFCIRCEQRIAADDRGFELPSIDEDGINSRVYYHRECLLEEVGLTSYEIDKHLEEG